VSGAEPLVRLAIRVRAADAELALARLLPVLPAGAEERAAGDAVEYLLYGAPAGLPAERELRALAGDALLGLSTEAVAPGWERAWQQHLERVVAGPFAVRPPWVPGEPGDLVIDPGLTFGAASHPTTRLCLELLPALGRAGELCDWGCGSGVLAIAAARLGFAPVAAVDADPGAVACAAANAEANGAAVATAVADVTREAPWAPAVVANLTLPLLEAAASAAERPPERLLASGVLAGQADAVAAAWGMTERERREVGGWAAVRLEAA